MTPLRKARKNRELSLQVVAEAVGIDPANLSRIERQEQNASLESAAALAKYFHINELKILYPQRYMEKAPEQTAA